MHKGCGTLEFRTRGASILGLAPPPSQARRAELAGFLRQRRAQASPERFGIERNGRRRTPGLRREEVAQLAGVGLSWYTWLEQGRDIRPSAQVLDALARALALDAGERAHLFHLARVELPLPGADYLHEAPAELRALVDALVPHPAYLLSPRTDVLAWNRAAAALLGEPPPGPDGPPNLLWWLFASTERQGAQWDETGRATLARFRAEHARRIGDPGFARLIDALERESERFRALWPEHEVMTGHLGTKVIEHPEIGTLRLYHLQSIPAEHPDLRLTQFAPVDDATRDALGRLVSGS
jgi:transcriptional regulator with XRE-family HTH domain